MPLKQRQSNRNRSFQIGEEIKEHQIPCSFLSRLKSFHNVQMFNDEPITYQTHAPTSLIPLAIDKLLTRWSESVTSTIPRKSVVQIPTPQWLAQRGFYYTPKSLKYKYSVTCSYCSKLIRDPIPIDVDFCHFHLLESPSCALSMIWEFIYLKQTNESSWKGDLIFGTVNNLKAIEIRRATFKQWKYNFPDVDQMAASGLYYDPLSDINETTGDDRVVCMYCGLNLERWEKGDDPVEAHKLSNPNCWVFNYFNFKETQEIKVIKHEPVEILETGNSDGLYDIEPYIQDSFSAFDRHSMKNDIEIKEIDNASDYSIQSLVTTTTTTAMPVEIIENDEVEEYLSNSQQYSEKMVDIPSIKSSELSQFFTELDAESENDVGASYFASSRIKRQKDKEERKKMIENVKPIPEELDADHHQENEVALSEPLQTENEDDEMNEFTENLFIDYNEFDDVKESHKDNDYDQDITYLEKQKENVKVLEKEHNLNIRNNSTNGDTSKQISLEEKLENTEIGDSQNDVAGEYQWIIPAEIEKKDELKEIEFIKVKTSEKGFSMDGNCMTSGNPVEGLFKQTQAQEENPQEDADEKEKEEESAHTNSDIEEEKPCEIVLDQETAKNKVVEKEIEKKSFEAKRVEKLEFELKFLKEQIAALQRSQSTQNQMYDETAYTKIPTVYQDIKDSSVIIEEVKVKLEPDVENDRIFAKKEKLEKDKVKSKKKKKPKRKHEQGNVDILKNKKLKFDTIKSVDISTNMDMKLIKETGKEKEKEKEKEKFKLEEVEEREKGFHPHNSSIVEPISLFHSDCNSLYENTPAISKRMVLSSDNQMTINDKLSEKFSTPAQVHERSKRVTTPTSSYIPVTLLEDPLNSPVMQVKTSSKSLIVGLRQLGKPGLIENKDDSNSEIPTQVDYTHHQDVEMEGDQHEGLRKGISGQNFPFIRNTGDTSYTSHLKYVGNQSGMENDNNKSPIMLRKNARSTPEIDVVNDLDNIMRNDTISNNIPYIQNWKSERIQGSMHQEFSEKLFLATDFMKNNQSTPHVNRVHDLSTASDFHFSIPDINPPSPPQVQNKTTEWKPVDGQKYLNYFKDIREATSYVKEVLDSPYELLGEDMDGLLTDFVAEIPLDQLHMTIRERLKFQENLAVRLVLDKTDDMMAEFRRDQQHALQFLRSLPEK